MRSCRAVTDNSEDEPTRCLLQYASTGCNDFTDVNGKLPVAVSHPITTNGKASAKTGQNIKECTTTEYEEKSCEGVDSAGAGDGTFHGEKAEDGDKEEEDLETLESLWKDELKFKLDHILCKRRIDTKQQMNMKQKHQQKSKRSDASSLAVQSREGQEGGKSCAEEGSRRSSRSSRGITRDGYSSNLNQERRSSSINRREGGSLRSVRSRSQNLGGLGPGSDHSPISSQVYIRSYMEETKRRCNTQDDMCIGRSTGDDIGEVHTRAFNPCSIYSTTRQNCNRTLSDHVSDASASAVPGFRRSIPWGSKLSAYGGSNLTKDPMGDTVESTCQEGSEGDGSGKVGKLQRARKCNGSGCNLMGLSSGQDLLRSRHQNIMRSVSNQGLVGSSRRNSRCNIMRSASGQSLHGLASSTSRRSIPKSASGPCLDGVSRSNTSRNSMVRINADDGLPRSSRNSSVIRITRIDSVERLNELSRTGCRKDLNVRSQSGGRLGRLDSKTRSRSRCLNVPRSNSGGTLERLQRGSRSSSRKNLIRRRSSEDMERISGTHRSRSRRRDIMSSASDQGDELAVLSRRSRSNSSRNLRRSTSGDESGRGPLEEQAFDRVLDDSSRLAQVGSEEGIGICRGKSDPHLYKVNDEVAKVTGQWLKRSSSGPSLALSQVGKLKPSATVVDATASGNGDGQNFQWRKRLPCNAGQWTSSEGRSRRARETDKGGCSLVGNKNKNPSSSKLQDACTKGGVKATLGISAFKKSDRDDKDIFPDSSQQIQDGTALTSLRKYDALSSKIDSQSRAERLAKLRNTWITATSQLVDLTTPSCQK